MTVTNLAELGDRITAEVNEALRMPALDACRAIAQEAGIRRARLALAEAPDRLAEAQAAYREAQAAEGYAKEAYQQALSEADWYLDDCFHTDGNRTYLRLPCEDCNAVGKIDGVKCTSCDGLGTTRKQMTADERKAWKAAEAAKQPAVLPASHNLRRCEEATAAARDAVGVADKRLSVAKYQVQAAIAELNTLAIGLQAKGA